MAQIHMNTSSVHLDGIDLTEYVKDVTVEPEQWQHTLEGLPDATMTMTFDDCYWNAPRLGLAEFTMTFVVPWRPGSRGWKRMLLVLDPAGYRRRKRMHAAYRRRRR